MNRPGGANDERGGKPGGGDGCEQDHCPAQARDCADLARDSCPLRVADRAAHDCDDEQEIGRAHATATLVDRVRGNGDEAHAAGEPERPRRSLAAAHDRGERRRSRQERQHDRGVGGRHAFDREGKAERVDETDAGTEREQSGKLATAEPTPVSHQAQGRDTEEGRDDDARGRQRRGPERGRGHACCHRRSAVAEDTGETEGEAVRPATLAGYLRSLSRARWSRTCWRFPQRLAAHQRRRPGREVSTNRNEQSDAAH